MSNNDTSSQQHEMECVRIEQNNNRDLEFEFICTVCGYSVVLPLFEVLARGDINVAHADSADGLGPIFITLWKDAPGLPQCFKDFLDGLEVDE